MIDAGLSMGQLAAELGVGSAQALADYLNGREELPAWVVLRLAEITHRPVWWFFDEQPQGITLEAAQVALQNVGRIRLYLDALESEFQRVVAVSDEAPDLDVSFEEVESPVRRMADVVDLSPYLARARAILEREVSGEESAEVSEESVEMVAQGLLSAETGVVPLLAPRASAESFEKVRRLPTRP